MSCDLYRSKLNLYDNTTLNTNSFKIDASDPNTVNVYTTGNMNIYGLNDTVNPLIQIDHTNNRIIINHSLYIKG
jgi:hypothetical protein